MDEELEQTTSLLAAERSDRAQLAVAGERSRIARDLHAVVARSVAAMVVQAEAARGLLDRDPATADAALEAVEDVGRQALSEMRRILGVLRHRDQAGDLLEPQPGVDQIYRLIERAREHGQHVELTIEGQPGPLPAGVDLGIYRILEDALASLRPNLAASCASHCASKMTTSSCSSPRRARTRVAGRPTRCASAYWRAAGS